MANCNKLFLDYNRDLKIKKKKRENLIASKDKVRETIKKHFKEKHPDYIPEFYIQGSYKMGTMIITKDDECDLDDGVYFNHDISVTGTTLQKWVKEAVKDITTTPTEHREKCVRIIYKSNYHIDLPVYHFPKGDDHPLLAVKDGDFTLTDPKETVIWYKGENDDKGQLNRIVKYLKGWCDYKRNKMPSGIAMTVLATKNIDYNDRDDIAIKNTLINIQKDIDEDHGGTFECIIPVTPSDDLFEGYSDARKDNFLSNLNSFIKDATKAVDEEKNQEKASKLWRKHFGDKLFPLGEDADVDAKAKELVSLASSVLSGNAYTQKDGTINEDSSGVKHQKHRNYGG